MALKKVELEFGTEQVYSCATRSYSSVRLALDPARDVDLSWDWQMKKTGSIPPGATVWWRWRLEDEDGRGYLSQRQELAWEDRRFQWKSYSRDNLTLFWYAGASAFGRELADAVGLRLGTLALGRELAKPIKAYVYRDAHALQESVLFAQEWAGGLAYGGQNILLIAIPPEPKNSHIVGLAHELAHLLIAEVTFNCLGDIPPWLNEGLALYAEGNPNPIMRSTLSRGIRFDNLISLRSLSSAFPTGQNAAKLSYAQSGSVVRYLLHAYSWESMRKLLAAFRDANTADEALLEVYGFDRDTLDGLWRSHVGAE